MPESGRDGQTGMQDERYGTICSRREAVTTNPSDLPYLPEREVSISAHLQSIRFHAIITVKKEITYRRFRICCSIERKKNTVCP